jgi:hypothetical protein
MLKIKAKLTNFSPQRRREKLFLFFAVPQAQQKTNSASPRLCG